MMKKVLLAVSIFPLLTYAMDTPKEMQTMAQQFDLSGTLLKSVTEPCHWNLIEDYKKAFQLKSQFEKPQTFHNTQSFVKYVEKAHNSPIKIAPITFRVQSGALNFPANTSLCFSMVMKYINNLSEIRIETSEMVNDEMAAKFIGYAFKLNPEVKITLRAGKDKNGTWHSYLEDWFKDSMKEEYGDRISFE